MTASSSSRSWTNFGLVIALLGIPAIVTAHRLLAPDPAASSAIIVRELAILALTAFLLWVVVAKERLPLSSVGIRTDGMGRSLAWGFGLAIVAFIALAGILVAYSAMGIHYGEGAAISRTLPVTTLAVLRAGI